MTRTQIGWAIAALGVAFCFALDAYVTQTTSLGEYNGGILLEPVLDGWAATPFLLLAALVLGRRLSLVAGVGGFLLVEKSYAGAYGDPPFVYWGERRYAQGD